MSLSTFQLGHGIRAKENMDEAMAELLSAAERGEFDLLFGDRSLRIAAIRLAEDPEYLCDAGSVPQDGNCGNYRILNCANSTFK